MAKYGPKKGQRHAGQFKPGQTGNPEGRPKLPEDLKALMKTTGEQMKRDICEVYAMPLRELMLIATHGQGDLSSGRAAIISCLNNSFQTGDFKALNVMLDRVLGRIPEALPVDDGIPVDLSKDETVARLVRMVEGK